MVFPIGERWALIALTVALFNPLVSLIAVLVWGVLAFAYTGALRTLRARWMWVPVLDTVDATLHRDDGPLARWLPVVRPMGPLTLAVIAALGPAVLLVAALLADAPDGLGWAVPVALLVLLVGGLGAGRRTTVRWTGWCPRRCGLPSTCSPSRSGWSGRRPGWLIFGYVFVLTVHHYDLTARLEKRQAAPPLHAATLGWEGRSVLLAARGDRRYCRVSDWLHSVRTFSWFSW